MSVPGRAEAAALLLSVAPRPGLVTHSRAVAEAAGWLARRVERRGGAVDRRAVESAALLHDIDKALQDDDPLKRLPHGEGSAEWLRRRGAPELAPIVANHPVTCLADAADSRGWAGFESLEAAIVSYADKRARQWLIPMSTRFRIWREKYPVEARGSGDPWSEDRLEQISKRARQLEAVVCDQAGVAPHEVGRLRWTRRALDVARQQA